MSYGVGTGVIMFFVSASVFAGCMFGRQVGFVLTAAQTLALIGILAALHHGLLPAGVGPDLYTLGLVSWISIAFALAIAALVPLVAMSAMMRALDLERQRADAALEVRSEFLARMSHELRTPMTGIIGMADLLGVSQLDNQQRGMITRLTQSARNLLALLNDLLDFSKIDSGRMQIETAPFSVSRVVADVCALFEMAAAKKGIAFTVHVQPDMPDRVLGDSYRVGQILNNLINNAVKFTDRGQVKVQVGEEKRDGNTVTLALSVIDTGIGISAPQLAELFQPFVQVDVSTSRRYGGSGLGLVISRSLAQAMGGAIEVSSEPGVGSCFTLRLPVKIDTAPAFEVPGPVGDLLPAARAGVGLKALVAEDDVTNRLLIVTMLEHMGHTVTAVGDGKAAVQAATEDVFDVIIMDMRMPVLDGFDAVRAIRGMETAQKARTPVIALTADLLPEHTEMFLAVGADLVVAKPVDWPRLQKSLDDIAATHVRANGSAQLRHTASR